jgi:hypothetical protein
MGFVLAGMLGCLGKRGEAAGDKDLSENVVVGDSAPFCLAEFQPKNEVNPAAGDLGFTGLACSSSCSSSDSYRSSIKSSVTPSSFNSRLGGRTSDVLYAGMFGIVGERACCPLAEALSSASLLCRCAWKLLTVLSCLGAGPEEARALLGEAESELCRGGCLGAVAVMGVWPWGCLKALSVRGRPRCAMEQHHSLVEVARYQVNEANAEGGRRQCTDAARVLGRRSIKDIGAAVSLGCTASAAVQFSRRVSSHNGRSWWQGLSPQWGLDGSGLCRLHGLRAREGRKGRDGKSGEEGRLCSWGRRGRRHAPRRGWLGRLHIND